MTMSTTETTSPPVRQISGPRAFRRIQRTAKFAMNQHFSPMAFRGGSFAAVGFMVAVVTSSPTWLLAAVGGAAFLFGYWTAPFRTWKADLYDQLAKYEPADIASFKRLQGMDRHERHLAQMALDAFIILESEAVYLPGTRQYEELQDARTRFLSRDFSNR